MVKATLSKQKTSLAKRANTKELRRQRRLRVITRRVNLVLIAVITTLIIGGGAWLWQQDMPGKLAGEAKASLIGFTSKMGMNLENVYVTGQRRLSEKSIITALDVAHGIPLYDVSLEEAKQRLEGLGWVKHANIARDLPNTLHVRITEREPAAIWQYKNKTHLVDREGTVIQENEVTGYGHLPLIVGEDANAHTTHLFGFLSQEQKLFDQVAAIIRVGNRRWNVRLKDGIEIKLPEKNPESAWQYLLVLQKEKRVLDRDIKTVDLRVPDRVFIDTDSLFDAPPTKG